MTNPEQSPKDLVEYAESCADVMLEDMSGEECVEMVRQFCEVMIGWQPAIRENREDPVMLGIHCLAAADLFKKAFVKGYINTDQRIKAQEAIKKALGGDS